MIDFLFSGPLYEFLYNVLIILYHLFSDNLLLAIVGIALLSRLVILPLTIRQMKMAETGKEFNQKVKDIRKRYKNNEEKQKEELAKVYAEHGPAQLAGCLVLPIQFLFLINIYNVIRNIVSDGASGFNEIAYDFVEKIDGEIGGDVLGIFDLKISPSDIGLGNLADFWPYALILIALGASQYFSTKIMTAMRDARKEDDKDKKKKKSKKKKKEDEPEDFGEIMQRSTRQAILFMPILIVFIFYGLPSGLAIYLIAANTFAIIQQLIFPVAKKKDEK